MASLYAITDDLSAISKLFENAVDENGDPRDLTETEMEYLQECFSTSYEEFQNKFDSYCKLIKNFKIHAENVEAERKSYADELQRLSKRSKAFANNAERLQAALRYCMDSLGEKKFKSELFTAGIQNTQVKVAALAGDNLAGIPEEFLKPRELDTTKIKAAIKDGRLSWVDKAGLDYGKIFDAEGNQIKGIYAAQGTALVIR